MAPKKKAPAPKKKAPEPPIEEPPVEAERAETPDPPSPVDRGQLYVESHPILGVLRKVTVTAQSVGDGREGDGATHVRE